MLVPLLKRTKSASAGTPDTLRQTASTIVSDLLRPPRYPDEVVSQPDFFETVHGG
jgi:hypothetical protein